MNQQAIEKLSNRNDGQLEVNSIFHTIQGEGPFCGTPAVFIRLAGCNLQCPKCDTEYTNRTVKSLISIVSEVASHTKSGLVVITGGEPFRQKIGPLIRILLNSGYYVQIETNGTLPPCPDVIWEKNTSKRTGAYIICSPKAGRINSTLEKEACSFKYVVTAGEIAVDGLPTHVLGHGATPHVARPISLKNRVIYLQPSDLKDEALNAENLNAAIASCMQHEYVLQLQIHKLIGAE